MELLMTMKDLIVEYYPIVVAGLVAVGGAIGIAYVTFTQAKAIVQPILDKIQDFRNKDEEDKSVASVLENIQIDTMKADLIYKIENETVNDELTSIYQTQLDKLNAITTTTTSLIDKVEDKVDTYL